MDVCLRARRAGVRTVYHPQLTLIHAGRPGVGEDPYVELARSRRQVLARHGRVRLDDVQQLLTFAARAAVKRPNDKERAQLSALLEVLRSG
jgi:GT2 family glycosyltransferase